MNPIIQPMTPQTFGPFGKVLAHDPTGERFQVFAQETGETGWQLAVNRIANRQVDQLARHPNTLESFAPIRGTAVLIVAEPDRPDDWQAFLLDGPVCVNKNVWHATLTLSAEALVAISENVRVDAKFHQLGRTVSPRLG